MHDCMHCHVKDNLAFDFHVNNNQCLDISANVSSEAGLRLTVDIITHLPLHHALN